MRVAVLFTAITIIALQAMPCDAASKKTTQAKPIPTQKMRDTRASEFHAPSPTFRGWDYLVERLRHNGVNDHDLRAIYSSPRMPYFTFVPFSLRPREPASMYSGFAKPKYRHLGAEFITRRKRDFDTVEATLKVPREVVAAILVVESQIGKHTGTEMIVYRLSRLASANAPENLRHNYKLQKAKDRSVTFEQVKKRGRYLEQTFLPEVPALISIAKRNGINPLDMRGSSAGAFGMPQFLPSAFIRYGMDGNKDGLISLHNEEDAMWSTANYLANFGFRRDIPLQEKRSIIWRYNRSKSYIDTIISLSEGIREEAQVKSQISAYDSGASLQQASRK